MRAPSDGYVTQVLIRPGTYAASLPLRPVMVFISLSETTNRGAVPLQSLLLAPGE